MKSIKAVCRREVLRLVGCVACALAAFAVSAGAQRTLQWVGKGSDKNFSTLGNFLDVAGQTNAVPRSGDTLKILVNTGSAKNDIADLAPYSLRLENYQTQSAASLPLVFTTNAATCAGIDNAGYLHYDFPTALAGTNVPVKSTSTMVCRSRFFSYDGQPCGILKTGSGTVALNGTQVAQNPKFTGAAFAGFKYVDIAEGTFSFGFNSGACNYLFPSDMTVTFSGAKTALMLRGPCAFTNFWLRETGAAVGAAHTISAQNDSGTYKEAHLKICGTVPEDVTTFTGTILHNVSFTWAPDAATQSFVFDGGVSTTTGDLAVSRGTVRLANGASFTQLNALTLSGGADSAFAVGSAPATAFHATRGELVTGQERLELASGATLRFGGLVVNGVRQTPGTYTSANAAWITGAGSVVVEGIAPYTYTWAKKTSYANLNWSTADNWVDTYGNSGVPQNGDTINLPGRAAYDPNNKGIIDANNNDLPDFHPRRIYIQGGYSGPRGKAVTFDGTDPTDGIYGSGYMYFCVPVHVNADAITVAAWSDFGYRADLCSTDGHRFRLKKTGDKKFGLGALESVYSYTGLSAVEIGAGTFSFGWQGHGDGTSYPDGLELQFTGTSTHLACSVSTTLRDAVISEASAVAGKAHSLMREGESTLDVTLTLTGVPPVQEQTFTGTLDDPLSFTWAPEASDRTFTFSSSNSVNATTKSVSVTNGTLRLAGGATFTNLGSLVLSGGTGTCFRVEDAPARAFVVTNLVLTTGLEKLFVAGGVKIACHALAVNGEPLSAGVYRSALCAGAGTGVDWMAGSGYLCVGGADIAFPTEPGSVTTASWTANGGSDTSVGNAANWGAAGSAALPDLDGGTLEATFAAGTGVALDRTARFRKLTLDAPGAFAFTAPDASAYVTLGSGGLATSGAGRAYTFAWPVYLLGNQTWTVGAGDTLSLDGLLGGSAARLVFPGGGTVNANRTQGYAGSLVFSNGVVNANADDCFGASASVPLDVHMYTAKLYLNGVTLHRTVRNITADVKSDAVEGSKKGYLYTQAGTENVIDGDLNLEAYTDMQLVLGAGSSLRVKGNFRRGRSYWCTFVADNNTGADVYFEKKTTVLIGAAMSTSGQVRYHFLAADNDFGSNWFDFNGYKAQIHTYAPYAFTATGNHRLRAQYSQAGRIFDLHGNDQGLTEFRAHETLTVRSDTAATLHLNVTNPNYVATNGCVFAGGAGLSFDGTKMTGLSGVSSTTGTVQVTQGELRFTPTGAWPNAAAAVVAGGTMAVSKSGTFGTNTVLKLSSAGKLDLAAGVRLKVAVPPELDGTPVANVGTYGSSQSNAEFRDDAHFTGPGMVVYGSRGLVLFIR